MICRLSLTAALPIAFLAVSYGAHSFSLRPETATVDFLDVGQGDAILIREGTEDVLIDGGPDRRILSELGRTRPFFDRRLERVFVTHPHDDHQVGILDVIGRYEMGEIVLPLALAGEGANRPLLERAERFGVPVRWAVPGDRFVFGSSALTVVWPAADCLVRLAAHSVGSEHDPVNACSLVLRYDHCDAGGCRRILLMADGTSLTEDLLLQDGADLSADILKVGHHGSRFATFAEFLRAVGPAEAVIQVGEKNTYGHPGHAVILRLRHVGSTVWRTDIDGPLRAVPQGGGFAVGPSR